MKRSLLWGWLWLRRRLQRLRKRLGLPAALSCRATLLILLALLALAYMSVAVFGDFVMKVGRYSPQFYEPKGPERELEMQRKKP